MYISIFWGGEKEENKIYYWSSWYNISFPCIEGGVGFKNYQIYVTLLQLKDGRDSDLKIKWINFVKAKYCPRSSPEFLKLQCL